MVTSLSVSKVVDNGIILIEPTASDGSSNNAVLFVHFQVQPVAVRLQHSVYFYSETRTEKKTCVS